MKVVEFLIECTQQKEAVVKTIGLFSCYLEKAP